MYATSASLPTVLLCMSLPWFTKISKNSENGRNKQKNVTYLTENYNNTTDNNIVIKLYCFVSIVITLNHRICNIVIVKCTFDHVYNLFSKTIKNINIK